MTYEKPVVSDGMPALDEIQGVQSKSQSPGDSSTCSLFCSAYEMDD